MIIWGSQPIFLCVLILLLDLKQSSSLHFKPFKPLENYLSILKQIEDLISQSDYEAALRMSQDLRNLALAGLHYFQTYDWLMLMTTITLGYIGWILNLLIHILQSYTSLQKHVSMTIEVNQWNTAKKVKFRTCDTIIFICLFGISINIT